MYAENAKFYHGLGLAVLPCGAGHKPDGKQALVRWKAFQSRKPALHTIKQWAAQFPSENIGAITGKASGITVIDVDDASSVSSALDLFGDTPLKVETPSGGQHLYFRFNGEKGCVKLHGLPIDIRAQGGLILLPPSVNLTSGKPYKLITGDYSLIGKLPAAKPLPPPNGDKKPKIVSIADGEIVEEGQRNQTLFHWLKEKAFECDNMEALMNNFAIPTNNLYLLPPLHPAEVKSVVESVWRYKLQGNLFRAGQKQAVISEHESELLASHPRALRLLIILKQHHEGLRPEFYAADSALAVKLGWDAKTVKAARRKLIELRLILTAYQGGKGPGDASRYRFP